MNRGAESGNRFPPGVVALLTFAGASILVLLLVLLFRGGALWDTLGIGVPASDPYGGFDTAAFRDRVEAELDPIPVRPVRVLRVNARQVSWRDGGGGRFVDAPRMVFTVDVAAGLAGGVLVRDGVVESPRVRLVQYESGAWNYESVLDPILAGGDRGGAGGAGGATPFALRNITLRNATVTVERPDASYAARALDVRLASADLSGPGVTDPIFRVTTAEGMLELPDTAGTPITRAVALQDATLRLVNGALAFQIDRGTFGQSTFAAARGVWDPALGGLGLEAELTATSLRVADVPWLRGEVPEGASGSFRLRIEALPGDRTALSFSDLALQAPGSAATGSLRAIFGPTGLAVEAVDLDLQPVQVSLLEAFTGPLPYTGELRGAVTGTGGNIQFDVQATLATSPAADPFTTQLQGTVAFTDDGVEIRGVTAGLDQVPLTALEAIAPGLPFAGPISGTVSISGAPGTGPITVDLRLEAGGGIITIAGTLDLTGAVPRYDVEGRLAGVEIRRVLAPAFPPVQLHATFDLAGRGTDPATADADLRLNGTFTGWESRPGDTLAVVASVAGGLLQTESLRAVLGPISLAAAGDWRFAVGSGGAIRYELLVASLEPLAPYLPADAQGRRRFASGSLRSEGAVSGTLEEPALSGQLAARDFRFGEWAAETLEGDYDVRLVDGLPQGEAVFAGSEIRTPTSDFASATLTADFSRPAFNVALNAEQLDGGVINVEAGGRIEEAGQREILLRTAEVDLEDQRWRLPSPARIAWTAGETVFVEGLRLEQTDGDGVLSVNGIIAPPDETDLALEIRSLPVGELANLLGFDPDVSGQLALSGTVRGPANAPVVELTANLREGLVRDVPVSSAEMVVRYAGAELTLDGTAVLGDSAFVEIDGSLPTRLALGFPPTVELVDGGAIDLALVTNDFPLATVDPGIRTVQDLEGRLHADVRIGGTPDEPLLSGQVELRQGAVTVPRLEQRYTEIEGLAVLEGRELTIRTMTARSGGTATAEGGLTFTDLTDPELNLTVTLQDFEPQDASNADDVHASGSVRVAGTAQSPVISGRVNLTDGTVDIAPFLGGRADFSNRLVGVAESFDLSLPDDLDLPDEPGTGLRIANLDVVAGPDVWFATEEARAQLQGTLNLSSAGDDITIYGTLEGQQGTFNLRVGPVTRTFNIVEANIRFLGGPEPDPALDVTASRIVRTTQGGSVDVRARVTGTMSNPQLSLGTAEGVAVAQSEILSYVLFGRPTFALSEVSPTQGGFLGELFTFAGAFEALSAELAQAQLFQELDQFQIQMRPDAGGQNFGFTSLWVVAGVQLTDEVFVTTESPLQEWGERFVLAVEWRIDRQWMLEASFAPVRHIGAGATGSLPSALIGSERQYLLVLRRRWTY